MASVRRPKCVIDVDLTDVSAWTVHVSRLNLFWLQVRPLLKMMQFIGAVYGGKSVTQVALNYLISRGVSCCGMALE